jgi:hypothetical protein
MKIIQCHALSDGAPLPLPMFVVLCDVDACDGFGEIVLTNNPMSAQQFRDAQEALLYYTRVSRVRPTRDDGEPNRPLRAFTIEIYDRPVKL